jgi:tetratricopeptide (TPR) repeat protein
VRNRSLAERWRKWRRRRPHGIALAGMLLAVVTAAAAVLLGAVSHVAQRQAEARAALRDGEVQLARGEWQGAIHTLARGRTAARGLPFDRDLAGELERQLRLAEQARSAARREALAHRLRELANRVRFLYGVQTPPSCGLRRLQERCRALWADRARIVRCLGGGRLPQDVRADLLDLAIFWADVQVRLAPPGRKQEARQKARIVLDEAEALLGPSCVLDEERRFHGAAPRTPRRAPRDAWEHFALGRTLLRSGDLDRAAEECALAVRLQPQGLWPNFYLGHCAFRQKRYADAVTAFSVCIGAAPALANHCR